MDGQLVVSNLTKVYPKVRAVDDLSFTVAPGRVTGFLGPNGSGKTTTLRMMLNLVTPTSGSRPRLKWSPVRRPRRSVDTVGAVLEASSAHQGRYRSQPPAHHLRRRVAIPTSGPTRCSTLVGLGPAGEAAGFAVTPSACGSGSGIAAAMLGDPRVLMLDEPANGLDPEGIRWMREFLRAFAEPGPHRLRLQPPARRDGTARGRPHHHCGRPTRRRRARSRRS